ncbi:hypothetical protein HanRHA438_Chr02g0080951 [Helianthus annuus]|nr:hypothetical protein HanRHA438_Chr02g0080951 [Helianthus annuus]
MIGRYLFRRMGYRTVLVILPNFVSRDISNIKYLICMKLVGRHRYYADLIMFFHGFGG